MEEKRIRIAFRRRLAAACSVLALVGGILATQCFVAAESAPDAAAFWEPLPDQSRESVPAAFSFHMRVGELEPDNAIYTVSILREEDWVLTLNNKEYTVAYDSEYTDVQCVADGMEILSQERVQTGEELTVKILPASSELRLSSVTFTVMNGDEAVITFPTRYGLNTNAGNWFDGSTKYIWRDYYSTLLQEGEITAEQYSRVTDVLNYLLEEPATEDPMLSVGMPIPLTIRNQPWNMTCRAGEQIWTQISATGSRLSYRWQYYDPAAKAWVDVDNNSRSFNLIFFARESYDGRYYRCVVTDENGDSILSDSVKLTVLPADAASEDPRREASREASGGQSVEPGVSRARR